MTTKLSIREEKILKDKAFRKNKLMQFAGSAEGEIGEKNIQDLVAEKRNG